MPIRICQELNKKRLRAYPKTAVMWAEENMLKGITVAATRVGENFVEHEMNDRSIIEMVEKQARIKRLWRDKEVLRRQEAHNWLTTEWYRQGRKEVDWEKYGEIAKHALWVYLDDHDNMRTDVSISDLLEERRAGGRGGTRQEAAKKIEELCIWTERVMAGQDHTGEGDGWFYKGRKEEEIVAEHILHTIGMMGWCTKGNDEKDKGNEWFCWRRVMPYGMPRVKDRKRLLVALLKKGKEWLQQCENGAGTPLHWSTIGVLTRSLRVVNSTPPLSTRKSKYRKHTDQAEAIAHAYVRKWLKRHLRAAMENKPKYRKCFERSGLRYVREKGELRYTYTKVWDGRRETAVLSVRPEAKQNNREEGVMAQLQAEDSQDANATRNVPVEQSEGSKG